MSEHNEIDLGIGEAGLYNRRSTDAHVEPENFASDEKIKSESGFAFGREADGSMRLSDLPVKISGADAENEEARTFALLEISDAERALATYLEVDLNASAEVLLRRVSEDSRSLLVSEIRMGLRLMALKMQLQHGEFLPAIAEIGIPKHSAQMAMRTARAFAAEGNARRREQILALGKTKGAALLAAKPELREMILDDPELSREAEEASKLDLQRLLKEKEVQIDRHQRAYAELEAQLEGRELELRKLSRSDPVSLLTRRMRAEAVADAAAIGECCANLSKLWGDAVTSPVGDESDIDMRQRAIALAVSAAMDHLSALVEMIQEQRGSAALPLKPGPMDDLSNEERQHAFLCADRVRAQFELRRERRSEEAYTEHLADGGQKKRGRPAKKRG